MVLDIIVFELDHMRIGTDSSSSAFFRLLACIHVGLGGNPATVGFNAGDMISFELVTGSNTDAVINISSTTNVGVPGKWAFKVNNATLTGITGTVWYD